MLSVVTNSPRYTAYCAAHGSASSDEQAERDEALPGEWPVAPFVHWIGHRIEDWCAEHDLIPTMMDWDDHARFNDWLTVRYPAEPA